MPLRLPLVLATLTACASQVHAWGGEGHQIIALIAEARLTPEAQAGIDELLGEAEISDGEVASWADNIRRERSRP